MPILLQSLKFILQQHLELYLIHF